MLNNDDRNLLFNSSLLGAFEITLNNKFMRRSCAKIGSLPTEMHNKQSSSPTHHT